MHSLIFSSTFKEISSTYCRLDIFTDYMTFTLEPNNLEREAKVTRKISFSDLSYWVSWSTDGGSSTQGMTLGRKTKIIHQIRGPSIQELKHILSGRIAYRDGLVKKSLQPYLPRCKNQQVQILNIQKIFLSQSKQSRNIIKSINLNDGIRELEILKMLRARPHPNLLGLNCYYIHDETVLIEMDHCEGGTLYDLSSKYDDALPPQVIKRVMIQLLEGLNHLHSLQITHLDIKFDNILARSCSSDEIVIIDFGLSVLEPSVSVRVGTCGYIAPEIFAGKATTPKCDIFSAGAVFHRLLTNYPIYNSLEENRINRKSMRRIYNTEAVDLLHNMLKDDPDQRYSAEDCLAHPYFIDEESWISKNISHTISPKTRRIEDIQDPSTVIL